MVYLLVQVANYKFTLLKLSNFEMLTNLLPCFLYFSSALIIAIIARHFINHFLSRSKRSIFLNEIFSTFLVDNCSNILIRDSILNFCPITPI